jgi:chromosomal replication initiation ATPase DnaA
MAGPGTPRGGDEGISFAARSTLGRVARLGRTDPAVAIVLSAVSEHRGVPLATLLQRNRGTAEAALARQMAMYLVHTLLGRIMTEVGALFGRDRTTVAHACTLIEDQRERPAFDEAVARVEACIAERLERPQQQEAHRAAG